METDIRQAIGQLSASVGKEIRKRLIDLDMKQTELAARIGENEMWISRRLRGAQPIDLNDLEKIASALNVEVADLLPRSNEGRVVTTAGTSATNQRSGHLTRRLRRGSSRMNTKPHTRNRHPIGRPQTGTPTPSPTGPPSQRRPALIASAG